MDAHAGERAAQQHGNISWEDAVDLGFSPDAVSHRTKQGRWWVVHDGVFAVGHVPRTNQSRWKAATMTTSDTTLFGGSAGALLELWRDPDRFVVVARPGSGGPRRIDGMLVCRTLWKPGDRTEVDGIPVTSAARTIVDLSRDAGPKRVRRLVRDALRRELMTPTDLWAALGHHKGRRGTRQVRLAAERYCGLPQIAKAMSDPEVVAQELLTSLGLAPSRTNARVAGHEADLVWDAERVIVELDSRKWHAFSPEDAEKDAVWSQAGFEVRRLPTDDVYDHPERLIALAPR